MTRVWAELTKQDEGNDVHTIRLGRQNGKKDLCAQKKPSSKLTGVAEGLGIAHLVHVIIPSNAINTIKIY